MRFRRFLESIESRSDEYQVRLRRFFPGQPEDFYQKHMQALLNQERRTPSPPDYNDALFNQYIHKVADDIGHEAPQDFKDRTHYGTAYPYYQRGATDPQRETQNIWVKHSADPNNHDRILACQFAAKALYTHKPGYADEYYEKLYQKRRGYEKPEDFWEVPLWVAMMARNLDNVDFYVVRDLNEAIQFFNQARYKELVFSVMDVVLPKVRLIAQSYPGTIAVGGYSTNLAEEFANFDNVHVFSNMQDFVLEQKNKEMQGGTDYSLFRGTGVIPRLCMSSGCRHKCKFCDVTRKLEEVPTETIEQEADAIAQLKSKLVYINDKTFGQADNYSLLPQMFWRIRHSNPGFQGFVVQTTASTMASKRLPNDFIRESGIRFIELGIETYNDFILKSMKKPATEKSIDLAAEKIRQLRKEGGNVWMIPNIIVGFPQETNETYHRTYDWLLHNKDIISHLNIYSLAVYDDTELKNDIHVMSQSDRDENQVKKSFHNDPNVHETWHQKFIDLANKLLDKDLEIDPPPMSFGDYVKRQQAKSKQRTALPMVG